MADSELMALVSVRDSEGYLIQSKNTLEAYVEDVAVGDVIEVSRDFYKVEGIKVEPLSGAKVSSVKYIFTTSRYSVPNLTLRLN